MNSLGTLVLNRSGDGQQRHSLRSGRTNRALLEVFSRGPLASQGVGNTLGAAVLVLVPISTFSMYPCNARDGYLVKGCQDVLRHLNDLVVIGVWRCRSDSSYGFFVLDGSSANVGPDQACRIADSIEIRKRHNAINAAVKSTHDSQHPLLARPPRRLVWADIGGRPIEHKETAAAVARTSPDADDDQVVQMAKNILAPSTR